MTQTSLSVESVLTEGLAALVAPAGVPWQAKANFDDPDLSARILSFTLYRTGRMPLLLMDRYALQIMGRGNPDDTLDVDELMGPIADKVCAIEHVDIGGVHINQIRFRSSIPLGIDQKNRAMRSDTFDLDVNPPATTDRPI